MPKKTGTVEYCGYKNKTTKAGKNCQVWSMKVDGEWYNCGFDKPERADGIRALAGDKVQFTYEENQFGKAADVKNMKIKIITKSEADEPKSSAPAKKSYSGNKGGGAKDDYWAKKDEFDKGVTQPLIMRQSCDKVASELVTAALAKDVLPLPTKKADKWETFMAMYFQVADELFARKMSEYESLKAGEPIATGNAGSKDSVPDKDEDDFDDVGDNQDNDGFDDDFDDDVDF